MFCLNETSYLATGVFATARTSLPNATRSPVDSSASLQLAAQAHTDAQIFAVQQRHSGWHIILQVSTVLTAAIPFQVGSAGSQACNDLWYGR